MRGVGPFKERTMNTSFHRRRMFHANAKRRLSPLRECAKRARCGGDVSSLAGFALIELIVSVGLFMAVMLVAVGALTSMAEADRKAQGIQAIVDNLNFALDDISRNVRTGTYFHCVDGGVNPNGEPLANLSVPGNCASSGSTYVAIEGSRGNSANQNDQIVYWYSSNCSGLSGYSGGCIEKSVNSGATFLPLTSPSVFVDALRFYVTGSCPLTSGAGCTPDALQPKAVAILSAHIPLNAGTQTNLNLQTTLTQRVYDQ